MDTTDETLDLQERELTLEDVLSNSIAEFGKLIARVSRLQKMIQSQNAKIQHPRIDSK